MLNIKVLSLAHTESHVAGHPALTLLREQCLFFLSFAVFLSSVIQKQLFCTSCPSSTGNLKEQSSLQLVDPGTVMPGDTAGMEGVGAGAAFEHQGGSVA